MTKTLHVLGVGHALVDIIATCEESILAEFALTKGTMRLTSPEEAAAVCTRNGIAVETSGGSAANTCAGIASLGGKAGFAGKVGRDQFAGAFRPRHSLHRRRLPSRQGRQRDPDGPLPDPRHAGRRAHHEHESRRGGRVQRGRPRPRAIESPRSSIGGLSLRSARGARSLFTASDFAHGNSTKVAFTLSDPFCVDRHRDAFRAFIRDRVDIVFANEKELLSLYPGSTFEEARGCFARKAIAAVTRSEKGAVIFWRATRP